MVANFQKSMFDFLRNIAGGPAQNMAGGYFDVAIPLLNASDENMVTPPQKPMEMKYETPMYHSTPTKHVRRKLNLDIPHAF